MRGSDHDHVDGAGLHPGSVEHRLQRIDDAAHDVSRGRGLHAGDDAVTVDHHGIRVRAADIDSNPDHWQTFRTRYCDEEPASRRASSFSMVGISPSMSGSFGRIASSSSEMTGTEASKSFV